jgi:hypothetical protein
MSIDVPNDKIDDWIIELKPYQRNTIKRLLKKGKEPEEIAKTWLTTQGTSNTIPFGGVRDAKPFWDNFVKEFNKFICDENEYKNEKSAFQKESSVSKGILISVISAALGARIGFAATLLVPAVTLLLFCVGKMTKNAYCATYYNKIETS